MISIFVGLAITSTHAHVTTLVVGGRTDGQAVVGDTLTASLSDGTTLTSYAWGSTAGGADYGTGSSMVVPAVAEGGLIYLTTQSTIGEFATVIAVAATPAISTTITAGTNEIYIDDLAPLPALPALSAMPGIDSITVEIA